MFWKFRGGGKCPPLVERLLECVWFFDFVVVEDGDKLYQALFKSYVLACPSKSKRTCQDELKSKWNEIKKWQFSSESRTVDDGTEDDRYDK